MDGPVMMRDVDVAVVGAGPAGIAAALTAARQGARVALLDEEGVPGGHLRWSLVPESGFAGDLATRRGFEIAAWARDRLQEAGVDLIHGVVWGLFDGPVVGIAERESSWQLRAEKVIIATGSTDVVWPFSGWELPGVMTTRAARRLINLFRVLPGRRIVVIGEGSDAEATADELRSAGGKIVARYSSPSTVHAGGGTQVEWISTDEARVAADCVVLALGRQPDPELALQAGCEVTYSEAAGGWIPRRTTCLESTVAGVFVVGEAAGAQSAAEAFAEGAVAGEAVTGGAGLASALDHLVSLRSSERTRELQATVLEGVVR